MTIPDPKSTLVDGLDRLNHQVLEKLDGLSEYDLRRPVTSTGTNLLGVVKHLASVQAGYFGDTFGRPFPGGLPFDEDDPQADLYATADETSESVKEFYRASWRHSQETFAASDLDTVGQVPVVRPRGQPAPDPGAHDQRDRPARRSPRHRARDDRRCGGARHLGRQHHRGL